MAKHYDKQFKLDAVQYYHDHKNLGLQGCATNLGISQQTLSRWQKELRETALRSRTVFHFPFSQDQWQVLERYLGSAS